MMLKTYTEIIEHFNTLERPFLVVVAELHDGSGEVYEASDRRDVLRDFQKTVNSGQYKQVVLLRRPLFRFVADGQPYQMQRVIVMAQWQAPEAPGQWQTFEAWQAERNNWLLAGDEDTPGEAIGGGNPEADLDDEYQAQHEALENEIAALVHKIRQYQEQAEEVAARISEAKDRLELLLKERGSNWSDDNGYARLTAPGVRTNYSTSALDALIINDPLRYAWLKQYRKESPLAARVMVR